jgi:hypothetical protein
MTMYVPNPEVRPTGEEAGEYIEGLPGDDDTEDDVDSAGADPSRRPTGSLPLRDDEPRSDDAG